MDLERSLWLLCGGGAGGGKPRKRPGKNQGCEGRSRLGSPVGIKGRGLRSRRLDHEYARRGLAHPPLSLLPPVLQAGPGSISRCGPRTALAAASLLAMAFATCPAARAPTNWTAPRGGPWAAGGSSWHGPSWAVDHSCCMGTPSTVELIATACTRPPVAPCTSSSACCCATSTATALNAEGLCLQHLAPIHTLDT